MRRTAQAKKQELITDLTEARRALLSAAAALPQADRDTPCLGAWSVHDIVAHLVGWDVANLEAIGAIMQGRLPAFYAHYDADWRTFNAELVAQHKRSMLDETLIAAQASQRLLLDTLDALPAEDVIRDYGVRSPRRRRVTVAMLLSAEAQDERTHCAQIRAFATQLQVIR
jgi:uncharacterized damage-inducible protein DinB